MQRAVYFYHILKVFKSKFVKKYILLLVDRIISWLGKEYVALLHNNLCLLVHLKVVIALN